MDWVDKTYKAWKIIGYGTLSIALLLVLLGLTPLAMKLIVAGAIVDLMVPVFFYDPE